MHAHILLLSFHFTTLDKTQTDKSVHNYPGMILLHFPALKRRGGVTSVILIYYTQFLPNIYSIYEGFLRLLDLRLLKFVCLKPGWLLGGGEPFEL